MASFTTSNVSNDLVGHELKIASSFVRQYYTILNKAPGYIHNFYSHDSTFIHGTIEMASEPYTEPVVGREKIKRKMEDLNLNDCRAKIKQIDCLETLAGGYVIQVIGELSNNGMPMRKFLQTFVLAPSPNEMRQDVDSQQQQNVKTGQTMGGPGGNNAARGVQISGENNNNSSHNQKFYVLNEIFRYQDNGPANEFVNDPESLHAISSVENTNNRNMSEMNKPDPVAVNKQQHHPQQQQHQQPQQQQAHSNVHMSNSNGATVPEYSQNRRVRVNPEAVIKSVENMDGVITDLEEGLKLTKSSGLETLSSDSKANSSGSKVVSNGTGNIDKKNETSEKQSTENGKVSVDTQSQAITSSNTGSMQSASQQPAPINTTATRPQPSSEPKTWANMVRNAHPPSTSSVQVNVNKPQPTEQQNATQASSGQAHHHPNQQQQQQQPQQQQLQPLQQQQPQQPQQQQPQNNRRRHMMRKPSNKSTGRSMKNRPPRPPQATTGTKPVA